MSTLIIFSAGFMTGFIVACFVWTS